MLDIPNRDHMRAVGDKVYKSGVLDFLVSDGSESRVASSSSAKCLSAAISTVKVAIQTMRAP